MAAIVELKHKEKITISQSWFTTCYKYSIFHCWVLVEGLSYYSYSSQLLSPLGFLPFDPDQAKKAN